jgi:hypothetical protein
MIKSLTTENALQNCILFSYEIGFENATISGQG